MTPDIEQDLRRLYQVTGLTAVAAGYRRVEASGEFQTTLAACGQRRSDKPDLVTSEDRWHIGSVTKSMTATLLAVMQDDGQLGLTETLADLVPSLSMHPAWRDVSLLQLLNHSAGLPANIPLSRRTQNPATDALRLSARAELLEQLLAKPPRSKPGIKFTYSNVGYTLAGHCAEVRAQQPFQPLLRERVWLPLGMHSAGFGPPAEPLGHRTFWRWRFPQDPSQGQVDNTSIIDPAGCAHMSMQDLLAFGGSHLAGRWPMLQSPALEHYACGWVVNSPQPRPYPLVWHNGSNTLWYCLLILAPEQQAVLAFATNDGAVRKAEAAFFDLAYQWLDAC